MEKWIPDKQFNIMTREEVRSFDAYAINSLAIPGVVLMENAGRSCAELIIEKLQKKDAPKVCIFCGTGNNGGDGYVIARHLRNNGFKVKVMILGEQSKIKGDAKINLDILYALKQPVEYVNPESPDISSRVEDFTKDADMIIDGLLGTGLTGVVKNGYKQIIDTINKIHSPVLSVDIPSGLDCDTGEPLGTAVTADYTVTFVALKKGFALEKAKLYTGDIYIASIGVNPD